LELLLATVGYLLQIFNITVTLNEVLITAIGNSRARVGGLLCLRNGFVWG